MSSTLKQNERSRVEGFVNDLEGNRRAQGSTNYEGEPRWDTWEATPFTRWTNPSSETSFCRVFTFQSAKNDFNNVLISQHSFNFKVLTINLNFTVCENTALLLGFAGSTTANTLNFQAKMTEIEYETSILVEGVFVFFEATDGKAETLNRETGKINEEQKELQATGIVGFYIFYSFETTSIRSEVGLRLFDCKIKPGVQFIKPPENDQCYNIAKEFYKK